MAARVAGLFCAMLLAAACQLPGASATCKTQIDWIDFIQIGSMQYVATPQSPAVAEGDLGPVYAHIKFKVSGAICDPSYRLKDGDAAFLDPGTPVYQVTGRSPAEAVAARSGEGYALYKAVTPAA
jgi:hypothetical protein